jgi:hypothetical protein
MRLIPTSGAWIETADHSTRQPGLSDSGAVILLRPSPFALDYHPV